MSISLFESMSLDQIRDHLRMMAKSEGGIGLDEGIINFDHIAELIHYQLNQNNGVIIGNGSNLISDHHMNTLIQILKQKEMEEKIRQGEADGLISPEGQTQNDESIPQTSGRIDNPDQASAETPNDQFQDDHFEHDFEDEEQLFNILETHHQLGGSLTRVKSLIKDANQQMSMTYQNKREELNYLYESQTKEL